MSKPNFIASMINQGIELVRADNETVTLGNVQAKLRGSLHFCATDKEVIETMTSGNTRGDIDELVKYGHVIREGDTYKSEPWMSGWLKTEPEREDEDELS